LSAASEPASLAAIEIADEDVAVADVNLSSERREGVVELRTSGRGRPSSGI